MGKQVRLDILWTRLLFQYSFLPASTIEKKETKFEIKKEKANFINKIIQPINRFLFPFFLRPMRYFQHRCSGKAVLNFCSRCHCSRKTIFQLKYFLLHVASGLKRGSHKSYKTEGKSQLQCGNKSSNTLVTVKYIFHPTWQVWVRTNWFFSDHPLKVAIAAL